MARDWQSMLKKGYREILGGAFGLFGLSIATGATIYDHHQKAATPEGQAYTECIKTTKETPRDKLCTPEKYAAAIQFQESSANRAAWSGSIGTAFMLVGAGVNRLKRRERELGDVIDRLSRNVLALDLQYGVLKSENDRMQRELDGRAEAERKRQAAEAAAAKEETSRKAAEGAAVLKEDIVISAPLRLKNQKNDGPGSSGSA